MSAVINCDQHHKIQGQRTEHVWWAPDQAGILLSKKQRKMSKQVNKMPDVIDAIKQSSLLSVHKWCSVCSVAVWQHARKSSQVSESWREIIIGAPDMLTNQQIKTMVYLCRGRHVPYHDANSIFMGNNFVPKQRERTCFLQVCAGECRCSRRHDENDSMRAYRARGAGYCSKAIIASHNCRTSIPQMLKFTHVLQTPITETVQAQIAVEVFDTNHSQLKAYPHAPNKGWYDCASSRSKSKYVHSLNEATRHIMTASECMYPKHRVTAWR